MIQELKNGDYITINMFGKEKEVEVFSTGDNQFDEQGNYKDDGFALNEEEIACLNWFIENVSIADYKKEITEYCNEQYSMWCEDTQITEDELEDELNVFAIAINIASITQSKSGVVYPEISYFGNCKCEPEHGICIGFRDKKFLGIDNQDWTL